MFKRTHPLFLVFRIFHSNVEAKGRFWSSKIVDNNLTAHKDHEEKQMAGLQSALDGASTREKSGLQRSKRNWRKDQITYHVRKSAG